MKVKEITLQSTVVRREDILASALDDEMVMMNIDQGEYYGLPAISTYIWGQLEEPRQVSAICDHLLTRFDVDRDTCQNEVLNFLQELHKEALIDVAETSD
jgi:hypothetical protein